MKRVLDIQGILKGAVAAALAVFIQGCMVAYDEPDFGGYRRVDLADGLGSEAALALNQSELAGEFPDSIVFTLTLRITDEALTYSSISITELTARYRDGTETRLARPWKAVFADLRASRPPELPVDVEVESLIFSHQDVDVAVGGILTKADGGIVPFRIAEKFKAGADRGMMLVTHW